MVCKLNYSILTVLLGICLVAAVCLAEWGFPGDVPADVAVEAEDADTFRLPVAMYHHILPTPSKWGDYVISPDQFEEDLKYLQSCGYTAITTSELLAAVTEDAPLPEKPILITFDDGYESVHEYAYPLLQQYGMKAVVSIIGSHTDLFSNPQEPRHINYSHLSWDQLREMQSSGVFEIGNHTYNMHEDGSNGKRYGIRIQKGESAEEYREALYQDIGALSSQMEWELGSRPNVFAYPFGALCRESRPLLTEMGFEIILTCEEKVNIISSQTEKPLVLRRFNRAHRYSTYDYFKQMGITPGEP